ncbi:MAG: hypothetical protein GXP25_15640 [Planctomycetes bacterium]|nr:hypothetical protein [Planctomycetota bacterium]
MAPATPPGIMNPAASVLGIARQILLRASVLSSGGLKSSPEAEGTVTSFPWRTAFCTGCGDILRHDGATGDAMPRFNGKPQLFYFFQQSGGVVNHQDTQGHTRHGKSVELKRLLDDPTNIVLHSGHLSRSLKSRHHIVVGDGKPGKALRQNRATYASKMPGGAKPRKVLNEQDLQNGVRLSRMRLPSDFRRMGVSGKT